MVAYSFKEMFVPKILSGTKRQTIRAVGKRRHARSGEELQLYTGMRTRNCRLIARAICDNAHPIRLAFSGRGGSAIIATGSGLEPIENLDAFARLDGFDDWTMMRNFFWAEHRAFGGFEGVLIIWRPIC